MSRPYACRHLRTSLYVLPPNMPSAPMRCEVQPFTEFQRFSAYCTHRTLKPVPPQRMAGAPDLALADGVPTPMSAAAPSAARVPRRTDSVRCLMGISLPLH
ncbi:hypothetical protein [Streptomyces sp. NPDC093094]|uniref:hypothetical protein n=1 Tax=Streptomyces sp. NPDC093094 TaxID=3366026 RepID=UPI0038140893